jgi:Fe2+ transport system protein FeoA
LILKLNFDRDSPGGTPLIQPARTAATKAETQDLAGPASRECMPLCGLRPGSAAVLCPRHQNGALPTRLQDLGFVPGTRLILVRAAPLGDPLEIEIRGSRFCLRREHVAGICVRPDAARPGADVS